MENTIYQIYDKMFKKILTLSSLSVVNLINGLFGTDYPKDSTVSYNWTEFEKDDLRKILADTILTINGKDSYHMEAQMEGDNAIILRVFDYSYNHALRNAREENGVYRMKFPEPKVIYLYAENRIPDEYIMKLDFGTQGEFTYRVSTFKYQEASTSELNERKMVILIPFKLLKLRKLLEKDRSKENLLSLKNLIQNDIIGSINDNFKLGNITAEDAQRLRRLTHKLYRHIYANYKEMEVLNEMTDESLMLDIDIILKEYEQKYKKEYEQKYQQKYEQEYEQKYQRIMEEERQALAEKKAEIADKEAEIADKEAEIADKEAEIADKEAEIANQKEEIARLKKLLQDAGISS